MHSTLELTRHLRGEAGRFRWILRWGEIAFFKRSEGQVEAGAQRPCCANLEGSSAHAQKLY